MRIGIDFCRFDPEYRGGLYNFSLGLTRGLLSSIGAADSLVIITSPANQAVLQSLFADFPVIFKRVPIGKWNKYIDWMLWVFSWFIRDFKFRSWWDSKLRSKVMQFIDESVDAVIVPTAILNFYALKSPSILCVHDIQHEYHPELFSPARRLVRWGSYRASCWQAAAIQASSWYIKNCLLEKFSFIEPGKIFIAHEGVDLHEFSPTNSAEMPKSNPGLRPNEFVFYPAQLWPHKNHLLLVDALAEFRKKTGFEMQCVLTGHDYGQWKVIRDRIAAHDLKSIYYLGRVNFPQMLWLYGNCKAVLALGFHESSSLPVREGAVFGKPLICVNIPPNIETQEFLRLKIVDKHDPADLAGALLETLEQGGILVRESAKNSELIKQQDWTSVARVYLSAVEKVISRRKPTREA